MTRYSSRPPSALLKPGYFLVAKKAQKLATEFQSSQTNLSSRIVLPGRVKAAVGETKVLKAKELYDGLVRLRPFMKFIQDDFEQKYKDLERFLEAQE